MSLAEFAADARWTDRNGLTVAVYEERFCADPRKKKERYLAQVVAPGASTCAEPGSQ